MSYAPARLIDPIPLTTSSVSLYTAPSRGVLLKQVILANTSASAVTARLSLLPTGVSIDGVHTLLPDVSVPANDVVILDAWQVLNSGDRLNGLAATGSVIIVTASGVLL